MSRFTYVRALVLGALLANPGPLLAEAEHGKIQFNRYQLVGVDVPEDMHDLLSSVIEVSFPQKIHTVGDALAALLNVHGFQLDTESQASDEQYILFMQPLPELHRTLTPMSLKSAIAVLSGEAFAPEINPVHRQVRFSLREGYMQFTSDQHAILAKEHWKARAMGETSPLQRAAIQKSAVINVSTPTAHYGPVQAGETLLQIVSGMPLAGLTTDQKLVALFDENPQAFGGNMNHLLAGAVLLIPELSANETESPLLAAKRVQQQYAAWRARQRKESR